MTLLVLWLLVRMLVMVAPFYAVSHMMRSGQVTGWWRARRGGGGERQREHGGGDDEDSGVSAAPASAAAAGGPEARGERLELELNQRLDRLIQVGKGGGWGWAGTCSPGCFALHSHCRRHGPSAGRCHSLLAPACTAPPACSRPGPTFMTAAQVAGAAGVCSMCARMSPHPPLSAPDACHPSPSLQRMEAGAAGSPGQEEQEPLRQQERGGATGGANPVS